MCSGLGCIRQYKYLQKVGSPGKVNRILQIIYMYYFCSIRHRRSHLVIFWVLLLLIKISFPPKQNSSHWWRWRYYSHMHYNYYWCYKSPAPRSCWVHPWIRWCTKFGHFMHFWQNYRQKILKGLWFFLRMDMEALDELLGLLISFTSELYLQTWTFTFDATGIWMKKHMIHILK